MLGIFPHGVIIHPKLNTSQECYTNDEFDTQIKHINNKIQELGRIQVEIKSSESEQQRGDARLSLLEYLKEQNTKLEHRDIGDSDQSYRDEKYLQNTSSQNITIHCVQYSSAKSQKRMEEVKQVPVHRSDKRLYPVSSSGFMHYSYFSSFLVCLQTY